MRNIFRILVKICSKNDAEPLGKAYALCRNFFLKLLCSLSCFEYSLILENLRSINRVFILFVFVGFVSSCSKDNNANLYEGVGLKSSIPEPGSYNYPESYSPYVKPYSRAYSNPYQPAPYNYSPYYDNDQYYVAPTKYRNVEVNYGSGPDNKY